MPKVKNYQPLKGVTATIASLVMAVFSFGIFAVVSAPSVSAASDRSTINVNVSDGLAIRVLDRSYTDLEELVFDFTPTDSGVYDTKHAIVEVSTSNATGYKLYMQSDWREDNTSSVGAYVDTESTAPHTTSLIHSGATSIPAVTDKIPTNLGTSYPYWYYYNDFYSEDKVIPAFGNPDKLAESENPTDGDYTTVPITVGVDTSIVAGAYRNKLVFTAIAKELPVDYVLHFDANATDSVSGMPTDLTDHVVASSKTFTVPSNELTRAKWKFMGWSEDKNATSATYKAGDSVTILADNQKLSTDQVAEKTLYAIWANWWTIEYMQDMTPEVCASVYAPTGVLDSAAKLIDRADYEAGLYTATSDNTSNQVPQRTLKDARDEKSYVVRKLADGNCWMTQNLALGKAGTNLVLTPNDSNVASETTITGSRIVSSPNGSWSANQWNIYVTNNASYGNYYGWYTAVAGSGNASTAAGTSVNYSVCPKQWKLPTGGANSDMTRLTGAYGLPTSEATNATYLTKIQQVPLSFVKSGGYWNALYAQNTNGAIWSRTAGGTTANAYNLGYLGTGKFMPQNSNAKYGGWPVRCIAI